MIISVGPRVDCKYWKIKKLLGLTLFLKYRGLK